MSGAAYNIHEWHFLVMGKAQAEGLCDVENHTYNEFAYCCSFPSVSPALDKEGGALQPPHESI